MRKISGLTPDFAIAIPRGIDTAGGYSLPMSYQRVLGMGAALFDDAAGRGLGAAWPHQAGGQIEASFFEDVGLDG
jgi:hypothetical protein